MAVHSVTRTTRPSLFKGKIISSMVFLPLVIVILYSSLAVSKKSDAELVPKLDELVVTVEHALKENSDGRDFQPRGTISLRSLKHQTGVFYQRDQLTKEELQLIQDMAESEDDVYYRIRVPSHFGVIEKEPETFVSTYVKACALYESRLTETITISVDHLGYIYGVGLSLPVSQCEGKGNGAVLPTHFNTTVNVVNQAAGALPDTQTYVQRLEKEKAENAAGKGKDNRSFLAKYWMYIVPVVIFMLMTSQQPDQQGGGEGGS